MRDYKHYCDNIENVENYDKAKADNFVGWECHHHTEQTKRKIGEANKNPSEETRKKMRESHIGQVPWNKGIPRTEEERKKMSEALKL